MEFVRKALEGMGLLNRVEILTLEVLDERHLYRRRVWYVAYDNRHAGELSSLGSAPAALAGDELKSPVDSPDYKRLDNTSGTNGLRQFVERSFAKLRARLIGAGLDQVNIDLKEAVICQGCRCRGCLRQGWCCRRCRSRHSERRRWPPRWPRLRRLRLRHRVPYECAQSPAQSVSAHLL